MYVCVCARLVEEVGGAVLQLKGRLWSDCLAAKLGRELMW